ncbi:metal-dependent hydrolase [Sphingorhabdus sp.]|uniref:metal-dependent hydrolase n=1 Tax=Sphingorhabdus sp. TaxID=1902408 RepID=UPI003BB1886E
MDNLTHSLVGALLGQMGLKHKTGLAMPTLIIAANIPDIDAVAVLLGGHQHLAIRRGITHGPIAMMLLPLLLWGAVLWFDRWQDRRGTRPANRLPVDRKWLLILAYIGCLSHPLFDWFNNYGVRLLEPFSSQWFYGDTLFIIDVWIWAALIAGVWLSLRRERSERADWRTPAFAAFIATILYIPFNMVVSNLAERQGYFAYQWERGAKPTMVVANPVPVTFWKRDVLWRDAQNHGHFDYSLFDAKNWIGHSENRIVGSGSIYDAAQSGVANASSDLKAFLFWSRMPVMVSSTDEKRIIGDQRFDNELTQGRFTVQVPQ